MKALEIFQPGWMMFGLHELRPSTATYEHTDYDSLPRIPQLDPQLAWLTPLHPKIDEKMSVYRPGDDDRKIYMENRRQIIAEAETLNLTLPDTFLLLSGSFELQDRIPSCTACYFDMPESIIESPFRAGDHIIRFLNDQQGCVCWYLYLPTDDSPFVVSSFCGLDYLDDDEFLNTLDFAKRQEAVDMAKQHTALAAKSFDEFIYRFWIENCIWYHLYMKLPLTPCQLQYARHIDSGYKDPNAAK